MWRNYMPFKIDRIDKVDSFFTTFVIHNDDKTAQEYQIPIWEADDFEKKVKKFTKIDMKTFRDKTGMKNARKKD